MAFYCNGKKGICDLDVCPDGCEFFDDSGGYEIKEKKPMTNGDRIRAMSDEELVKFFEKNVDCCGCMLYGDCTGPCPENWLNWLKQPAEADS